MFGSTLLERAANPPTGTVPFGAQGAPKASSEGGNARPPSTSRPAGQSTQPFSGAGGAGARNANPAPARSGTHLYGENHPLDDGPAAASSTMPFAGSPSPAPARAASKEAAKSPAPTTTMPFAGGTVQPAQPSASPKQATRAPVALPPEAPADSPAARRRAPVELPAAAALLFEPESQSDPEAAVRAQLQRRNRTALVIVLALVIGIPAILVLRTIAKRRSAIPAQVIAAEENAIGLLRRDDRHSRAQAIKDIDQLVQSHAAVASVRALQVLALTLELDDVKVGVKRIQAQSEEINRKLARMRERRSPADWETQITRGIAQLQALKQQSDPLVDEASTLDKKVSAAFPELLAVAKELSGPEELAVTRAEAVYFGVKGSDRALHLSERYRLLGGKDGWDTIAFGEYAANAHVAPDTLAQARAGLEGLRTADSAFLRAYVLAARLALAQREHDAASTLIEAAVALNPSHELARQVVAWVDESRRSEPTWPTPPLGPPR